MTDTDNTGTDWERVTRREPCEICGIHKWCSRKPDVNLCMRVQSAREVPNGRGYLHDRVGVEHRQNGHARHAKKPAIDWRPLQNRFVSQLTPEKAHELADLLHVELVAIVDLGVGYDDEGNDWTTPMYGPDGSLSGIKTRTVNGEKFCIGDGKLGVFRRQTPTDASDGVLLICEGESDTLAALSMGIDAIGVSGAGNSTDAAVAYCRDRDAVIVSDPDEAGIAGAEKLAKALAKVAKSVKVIRPPAPHKDLRAAFIAGWTRDEITALIAATKPLAEKPRGRSPLEVLGRWHTEGPLVHEPTGIPALDHMTGGGPCYGHPWGFLGGPDAAKTLAVTQIGHTFAKNGVLVGMLCVDEDEDGLLTRLAQRAGVARLDCERRDKETLQKIETAVGKLPMLFYSEDFTIDSAAEQLAAEAARQGKRAALIVDSLQTARCAAEASDRADLRVAVTLRVAAIKTAAMRHHMIVLFTSEVARTNYKTTERDQSISEMAAGKESGSIEYASKVQVTLRATDNDTIELRVSKNKFGRRHLSKEPGIALALDRQGQRLTETGTAALPVSKQADDGNIKPGDLQEKVNRIIAAMESLPNKTATSKSAIYAAAGMKPANGLPAVEWMLSQGKIQPGGTTRHPTYTLLESARVQTPTPPMERRERVPIGIGNGRERERERERQDRKDLQ